jgi:hypothetical protein
MNKQDVENWAGCALPETISKEFVSMATLERAVDQVFFDVRRNVLQQITQKAADQVDPVCPRCSGRLQVVDRNRSRTVQSQFGPIEFNRFYGFCPVCQKHAAPADHRLGLHEHAKASPRVQEIAALSVLRAPADQAAEDILRLTGIEISASTLHREARRQGGRALELREKEEWLTQHAEGIEFLQSQAPEVTPHATMVIEIDAWNIRERDHWGQTAALQKAGKETGRWHWVYTGTVFLLDQRGKTASGRPVISSRGYVATRKGIESFRNQLYAEALRRGMSQCETVLVLADGAAWIWNLADDRFAQAKQRLDLYHVRQHLWALAAELYGAGTDEAEVWVRPYIRWLDSRTAGAADVIEGLEELTERLGEFSARQAEVLERELNYFRSHQQRMDYKAGKARGEPVGSGAIESTCAQYQRRFKLTGQFWSLEGDEAFLALHTLHRNGRWAQLFPQENALRN